MMIRFQFFHSCYVTSPSFVPLTPIHPSDVLPFVSKQGCHGRLKTWAESNADCLLGIVGGVVALELVVVFLTFCLCAYSGEKTKWQCDDPEDQQHLHPTLEEEGGDDEEPGDAPKNTKPTSNSKSDPNLNDTTDATKEKDSSKKEPPSESEINSSENPSKEKNAVLKEQNPPPSKENSTKVDSNKDAPKIHSKAEFNDFDDIDKVED